MVIFSKDVTSHIQDVAKILLVVKDAGLSPKLKKCKFCKQDIEYLGHIVTPGKLGIDPKKTPSLGEAKSPRMRTQLRAFLGMANVSRRSVQDFAKIAELLTELL